MPAPMPITIRYGQDPSIIGGLAAASGSASYNRMRAQQDYDNWLRQHAMDMQFTNSALDRQHELEMMDTAAQQRPQESLAGAAGYGRRLAQKSGTVTSVTGRTKTPLELQMDEERLEGMQLRNDRAAARNQPEETVPLDQDRNPSMSMRNLRTGDEFHTDSQGNIITNPGPDQSEIVRGRGVSASRGPQVSRGVRDQIAYLDSVKDSIPQNVYNSMRVAAMSGGLKMDQLIDDVRSATGGGTSDSWVKRADELNRVAAMDPRQQAQFARERLRLDPFLYPDDGEGNKAALEQLARHAQLVESMAAQTKPVQNSGGRTPSGGNVVTISTQTEFNSLPSGTYYRDSETGQLERKP